MALASGDLVITAPAITTTIMTTAQRLTANGAITAIILTPVRPTAITAQIISSAVFSSALAHGIADTITAVISSRIADSTDAVFMAEDFVAGISIGAFEVEGSIAASGAETFAAEKASMADLEVAWAGADFTAVKGSTVAGDSTVAADSMEAVGSMEEADSTAVVASMVAEDSMEEAEAMEDAGNRWLIFEGLGGWLRALSVSGPRF